MNSQTTLPALSLALLALGATSSLAAPAAPRVYDARPAAIVEVLKTEGYKPEFKAGDDKAAPSITLKVKGDTIYLYFSGCKNGSCMRVGTANGFERPSKADGLAATLAEWNGKWYSQAYEEKDGTVYLDASYVLKGGFTGENFLAWFDSYLSEYEEFADLLY